jgi:hypothetical protein
VAAKWQLKLVNPARILRGHIGTAWEKSLVELQVWLETTLVRALVFGGMGLQGIAQTEFYKFVSSREGLSQLGIEATEPPKLLKAYETKAFKVERRKRVIRLKFGNVAQLKVATQHPAKGQGHLNIRSWLEWVLDGTEAGRGYVPRSDIDPSMQKNIRLGQPLGGLMLPRGVQGSTGLWRFPSRLQNYEDAWFRSNSAIVQRLITEKITDLFKKNLNG